MSASLLRDLLRLRFPLVVFALLALLAPVLLVENPALRLGAGLLLAAAAAALTALGARKVVAELEAHLAAVEQSENRYRQMFTRNTAVKLLIDPADGGIVDANPAAAAFYGWPLEELRQMRVTDINVLRQQEVLAEMELARVEKRLFFRFRHRLASGEIRDVEVHSSPVRERGRDLLISIVQDVTERRALSDALERANRRLREQTVRDSLTGLYNRRFVDEALPREVQRARRRGQSVAALMIDIDHFKRFNDEHGHQAGDAVLQAIGRMLLASVRGEDLPCRFGGEEFLVLLPEVDEETARQRADQIRVAAAALRVSEGGVELPPIRISVGVAAGDARAFEAPELVAAADKALYVAKAAGRDQVAAVRPGSPPA